MDFLITADIKVTEYMQDEPTWKKGKVFLVDSDSQENAVKKLKEHFEKKSDTYGTSYDVWDYEVAERI